MSYRHLLLEAAPNLPTVTCWFWDDIGAAVNGSEIEALLGLVEFQAETTFVEHYQPGGNRPKRLGYDKFLAQAIDLSKQSVSVYTTVTDALEQTWFPPKYATIRLNERVKFIALYSVSAIPKNPSSVHPLVQLAREFKSGAAYEFTYPLLFSPVAYLNGLSYSPNDRSIGRLSRRDELRVSNYRDHCWRGHRASEGYIRDVYDIVVFPEATADRKVGRNNLTEWITDRPSRGQITKSDDLFVWDLEHVNKDSVQLELDQERILLAGFEPV